MTNQLGFSEYTNFIIMPSLLLRIEVGPYHWHTTAFQKSQPKNKNSAKRKLKKICCPLWGHGAHSANFGEKVHKPKSKFYGSLDTKQLIFTHTVFPRIVSAETILFWKKPYVLWPLVSVHTGAETIQGRKLFKGGNYSRKYGKKDTIQNFSPLKLLL